MGIGVTYNKLRATWVARRWSKNEKRSVRNGTYKDEETAAHASDTLARKLTANGEKNHQLNFLDDDTEVRPEEAKFSSNYIGVTYNKIKAKWSAYRWSKNEKKKFFNGTYKDEEITAHASDTLARQLIANGEKGHQLNFPDDETEVYPEQKNNYFGVSHNTILATWQAIRRSKYENTKLYNGTYKDEETAAHASDTLARKLIAKGEKGHQLNFPDDDTEVIIPRRSDEHHYIGIHYHKRRAIWVASRRSKNEKTMIYNGSYKDEKTAAHASDTLARKLIDDGEKGHRLNFPDDDFEEFTEEVMYPKKKRKRQNNCSQESKSHQKSKK